MYEDPIVTVYNIKPIYGVSAPDLGSPDIPDDTWDD